MRSSPVHRLHLDSEQTFSLRARSFLALIDVETYPGFVGEKADGLDVRAHLQRQTQALTVVAWDVSRAVSRIRLTILSERRPMAEVMPSGRQPFATGWIRSFFGRLSLVGNELLEACAHDRERDFLRSDGENVRPHVVEVPPGTYAVSVFAATAPESTAAPDEPSDLVILRHYPFPPPRVAPVRLGGLTVSPVDNTQEELGHKRGELFPPPVVRPSDETL